MSGMQPMAFYGLTVVPGEGPIDAAPDFPASVSSERARSACYEVFGAPIYPSAGFGVSRVGASSLTERQEDCDLSLDSTPIFVNTEFFSCEIL
ncbi:hypothetical protein LTR66_003205 [Elasticomyces elasticus]|nr:hypothetical protein LTR50_001821 [Elasticomyces elasticus]KAK4997350.1 hypothetical protein LTR66_003205 [Elasticomyces elasticus]